MKAIKLFHLKGQYSVRWFFHFLAQSYLSKMLFFYEPRYAKFQCLFRRFMVAREYAKSILSYSEKVQFGQKSDIRPILVWI